MNTPNQSEPDAVVVPGPDYKLAVPELDSPVLDLLNSTVSEELIRVTPSGNCYSVRYRSTPDAEWEALAEVATMQEAVKKAAYVQEFGVEIVKDSQTGLGEVYLNPGRAGGIAVRSREHFPIQLTHTATDPIRGGSEILIEAPSEQERVVFGKPAFTVKTRTARANPWQTIHTVHEFINPAEAITVLGDIANVGVWTPDTPSALREFVEKSVRPSSV